MFGGSSGLGGTNSTAHTAELHFRYSTGLLFAANARASIDELMIPCFLIYFDISYCHVFNLTTSNPERE
jgi:hypothetical protein